jgi:hypothetical protein
VTGGSAQLPSGIAGRQLGPGGCGFDAGAPPGSVIAAGLTGEAFTQATNAAFGDAGAPDADGIGLDDTLIEDPQDLLNATTAATVNALSGATVQRQRFVRQRLQRHGRELRSELLPDREHRRHRPGIAARQRRQTLGLNRHRSSDRPKDIHVGV